MKLIGGFFDWLDDRTGYRDIVREALYENVPGGSRWRYVWGSTLVFTFVVQVITGSFLWMCYSPSAQTAWESVYYIEHHMQGGAWLRGIHHFTAQVMIVLLALHLWQVVIDGAYKAPREVNFWLGLILLQVVLGLSLTGYLLPWDQKGYWATKVATNIMGSVPVAGEHIKQVVVGGSEYGHHTLTRFFALHAGVLPGALMLFLALHLYVFRRHGLHYKAPKKAPDGTFWPDQIFKDGVACLAVLAIVLFLVKFLGADLGAPADAASPYDAARPEWYFLFLFQFLKFFKGEVGEFVGAVVIPGLVMGLLFAMPIVGRWKLGHTFNVVLLIGVLLGAGVLTGWAWFEDRADLNYRNGVWEAEQYSMIAEVRSAKGIPATGAGEMMRADPHALSLGQVTQKCLGCHSYTDASGHGFAPSAPTAANLHGFATRDWIAGLLNPDKITGPDYFGNTKHLKAGTMVGYIQGEDFKQLKPDEVAKIIAALAAEADGTVPKGEETLVEEGRQLIASDVHCVQCHTFRGAGVEGTAPDLTGYGSADWIFGMISNPDGSRYYGHLYNANDSLHDEQVMPAYGVSTSQSEADLSPETISLIADFLRGTWPQESSPEPDAQPTSAETPADAP